MKCLNPQCNNETNSEHSKYCKKCSIRHHAKNNGYELLEDVELNLGNEVGYVLKLR